MSKQRAPESELDKLHADLARKLRDKVKSGEATAADLSVARQFLKDNSITSIPQADDPLRELADSLPYPNADDIANSDNETLQ